MDKLWAPWRAEYTTTVCKKQKGCIFCRIMRSKKDKQNYIFVRSKYCFSVLNLYPYNNGHTLVMPSRHVSDLEKLKPEEIEDLMHLLNYTKQLLEDVLKPHGFNIGMNLGRVAGAGVPGHIHFHIVPRWNGDVNFMPVLSGTKVISQSLKLLYTELGKARKRRRKA